MQKVLQKRSVVFWLHIYRRIGVDLDERHENKTDSRTTGLVREIVELAILKHGRLDGTNELILSDRIHFDRILGGVLRQAVKAQESGSTIATSRKISTGLRSTPQWVIREFDQNDFVGIYYVEGLAYQYWRLTALLRTLGKGASVTFDADGNWTYETSKEFDELIKSIDERTDEEVFDRSLIGVWFGKDS